MLWPQDNCVLTSQCKYKEVFETFLLIHTCIEKASDLTIWNPKHSLNHSIGYACRRVKGQKHSLAHAPLIGW